MSLAGDNTMKAGLETSSKNGTWRWQWAHCVTALVLCPCPVVRERSFKRILRYEFLSSDFLSNLNFGQVSYGQTDREKVMHNSICTGVLNIWAYPTCPIREDNYPFLISISFEPSLHCNHKWCFSHHTC